MWEQVNQTRPGRWMRPRREITILIYRQVPEGAGAAATVCQNLGQIFRKTVERLPRVSRRLQIEEIFLATDDHLPVIVHHLLTYLLVIFDYSSIHYLTVAPQALFACAAKRQS